MTIDQQEPTPSTSGVNIVPSSSRKRPRTLHEFLVERPLSAHQKKLYYNLILNLVNKDLQPFSIVEDKGFMELIAGFHSAYQLASRTTLTRTHLPETYSIVAEKVRLKLKDISYITVTTDTWTSIATENYMSLTPHFIDNIWKVHTILVDCFKFSDRHTSENLKAEMARVLTEWDISDKVHTVVTDNARNITNAVKLTDYNHLPCLAHTLNLIVQGALKKKLETFIQK